MIFEIQRSNLSVAVLKTQLMSERQENNPSVEEIKTDLRDRCARIPFHTWRRIFPNLQLPVSQTLYSNLLPSDSSYTHKGKGNQLETPHVIGNDVVTTFLSRNGRIIENLVHYKSDDLTSERLYPDEILGETSDETYQNVYPIAIQKLDWLVQQTKKAS